MTDDALRLLLASARTIAVVGLSSRPGRASLGVARFLQQAGYRIIPVNPQEIEVLGVPAVATLDDIPFPVDIVNIFRRPEFVPEIVEAAIRNGARCVWMQDGAVHEEAGRRAEGAGLQVIMNQCILQIRSRLIP